MDDAAHEWTGSTALPGRSVAVLEGEASEKAQVEAELIHLRAEIETRGGHIARLQSEIASLPTLRSENDQLRERANELDGKLRVASNMLNASGAEVRRLAAEILDLRTERNDARLQREQDAAQSERDIARLLREQADFRHEAARLAELEQMNAAMMLALVSLREVVRKRSDEVAELEQTKAALHEAVEKYALERARRQRTKSILSKRLLDIAALEGRIADMKSRPNYRIMAPFREVARGWRRLLSAWRVRPDGS